MSLLRQWQMLEAVLLPVLVVARPLERLVVWNLAFIDDALAVSLLYLYCLKDRSIGGFRVYHSGSPPPSQPIEWGYGDIRGVPRGRWVEPVGSRRNRWAPRREAMEAVVLGRPPSAVDLLIVGDDAHSIPPDPAALDPVRRGGHVLFRQAPPAGTLPAAEYRPVGGHGLLFQKLVGEKVAPAPAAEDSPGRTLARHNQEVELVGSYLSLARALARRFRNRGERPEDLEQVAVLALVKAAGRYSPDRGSFGGFATTSILGELKRHFRDQMWMVRVPRSVQETHLAVRAARDELYQIHGSSPTIAQIAEHLGTAEDTILAAMDAAENCWPTSLDAPSREGDDGVTDVPVADGGFDMSLDRRLLREAIPRLSPTEKLIVRRLYFDGCTQRQVAEEIGVSQMQISRIMARTMSKLRQSFSAA